MNSNPGSKLLVKRKYETILIRSFETRIELFLFNELMKNPLFKEIDEKKFSEFEIKDELIKQYQQAWQMEKDEEMQGFSYEEMDDIIYGWWHKEKVAYDKLLKCYRVMFNKMFPFSDFEIFYPENDHKRSCHYCGLAEQQIALLRKNGMLYTKRGRGRHMEIDRKNSNQEYIRDNVVLACYWCNNAKSDEFTMDEFQKIGNEIRTRWAARLDKIKC